MGHAQITVKLAEPLRWTGILRPRQFVTGEVWLEEVDAILTNNHSGDMPAWREQCFAVALGKGHKPEDFGLPAKPSYRYGGNETWRSYRKREDEWQDAYGDAFLMATTGMPTLAGLLDSKRDDPHYSDVLESIEEHGFIRPLTARREDLAPLGFMFGDGHHRLAAAQDLGYTHVPLEISRSLVNDDSGEWDRREEIPNQN